MKKKKKEKIFDQSDFEKTLKETFATFCSESAKIFNMAKSCSGQEEIIDYSQMTIEIISEEEVRRRKKEGTLK